MVRETIKVAQGNEFVIAVPLVQLNRDGSTSEIDAQHIANLRVVVDRPCGTHFSPSVVRDGHYLVLSFSESLVISQYNITITAALPNGKYFCLPLKAAFEIVKWDKDSNWRDFVIADRIELPTQPTIAGWYNDTQPYIDHVEEVVAECFQRAREFYGVFPIIPADETLENLPIIIRHAGNANMQWCRGNFEACSDMGADLPPAEDRLPYRVATTIRTIPTGGQPTRYIELCVAMASSPTTVETELGYAELYSPAAQTQREDAIKLNASGYIRLTGTQYEQFHAGDVVSISVYNSGSSSGKKVVGFRLGRTDGRVLLAEVQGHEDYTFERVVLKAEDIAADGTLYIYRYSADGWFVNATVERAVE